MLKHSARTAVAMPLTAACFALLVSACGAPPADDSAVMTVREAQTENTDAAPVLAFVAAAKQVLAAPNHAGSIPASKFIALIPLSDADRDNLDTAYPGAFDVKCDGPRCSVIATGMAGEATLLASVKVNFFITVTNPTLQIAEQLTADFTLRGEQGIEVCNVSGMSVTKLGVTQVIYGLYDRLKDGLPKLTVADAVEDFGCEP